MYQPLALLYFGPKSSAAAGSNDVPRGNVLLLLYVEYRPIVLVGCHNKHLPIVLGDVINIDLSLQTIIGHAAIARQPVVSKAELPHLPFKLATNQN